MAMNDNTLLNLIPRPLSVVPDRAGIRQRLSELHCSAVPDGWNFVAGELDRINRYFALPTGSGVEVRLEFDAGLTPEAWVMKVETETVNIAAGNEAGGFYALTALAQMVAAAMAAGEREPMLDCGLIRDSPRFAYRGFMLDSARHFQSIAALKKVLRLLAVYRINFFHWHLTDNQGYRAVSAECPELNKIAEMDTGCYSAAEIRELCDFAHSLYIEVVPELDMPGHSRGVCALHPELACGEGLEVREYCLGKPASEKFLQKRLMEFMALFPDSCYLHIGGDEAQTKHWEACPDCRAALAALGGSDFRLLENAFMQRMCDFVSAAGRRPVVWCTGSTYSGHAVVQAWQNPEDSLKSCAHGNPMIWSLHRGMYFDYPESTLEPHPDWMPVLSADDVYAAAPFDGWITGAPGQFMGVEACLWTENIPERRVLAKLIGRLSAYSEVAWTQPYLKVFGDFKRRQIRQAYNGFTDFSQYFPL